MSGNKVYADSTSVVGGLSNGFNKMINKTFADYISTVTYQNHLSAGSEAKKNESFDP